MEGKGFWGRLRAPLQERVLLCKEVTSAMCSVIQNMRMPLNQGAANGIAAIPQWRAPGVVRS